MGGLGKRVIGIMVGVGLFIGIEEVRSRWGSSAAGYHENVTQEDADLYMRVQRATADRVKNPAPEDLRIMDDFSRIKNARTASANQLSDAEKETIMKAIEITSNLDKIVAHDMRVDEERYGHVKDVVESALATPDDENTELSPELTMAEKKALETKGTAVASYASEIKQLYAAIWNNPLRKTVKGS